MTQPIGISLLQWAAALIVDFPTDNVGILRDQKNWKEWGRLLIQEISFAENGAPSPDGYSEPFPWQMDVFNTMQNFA